MLLRSTLRCLDRLTARLGLSVERAPHLVFGSRGEDEAYFYLRTLGFTVVARDYRSPRRRGDIDLIAWEKDTLCFVEVKTRSRRNFMAAEAAVDDEKRTILSALGREYLRQCAHAPAKAPRFRFDVMSVYLENNAPVEITLFREAFRMS
jgi:putative endonuclease